jgi:hypothetical protein
VKSLSVTFDRSWFSLGPSVSSINKTVCHDIAEILLKVTLNTIKQANAMPLSMKCQFIFWVLVLLMEESGVMDKNH